MPAFGVLVSTVPEGVACEGRWPPVAAYRNEGLGCPGGPPAPLPGGGGPVGSNHPPPKPSMIYSVLRIRVEFRSVEQYTTRQFQYTFSTPY